MMNATSADMEEALDNQITLDPADNRWSKAVEGIEDGTEFEFSGKARQVSPGVYKVVAFEPDVEVEEESDTEETPATPAPKNSKVSSAVRAMANAEEE